MLVEFDRQAPTVARIVQLALAAGLAAAALAATAPGANAAEPEATALVQPDEGDAIPDRTPSGLRERRAVSTASPVSVRTSTLDPRTLVPTDFADWERDER